MATLFTPSTEFVNTVDGLETLASVAIKFQSSTTTRTDVDGCKRSALTKHDAQALAGLYVEGQTIVWHVPAANLSGSVLKAGDVLTDSSSVPWSILSVQLMSRGTRWRAVCVRERA